MAATTHLGSRVLGRVEAGNSSEGPVGPLHIGGQLIGGGRRGGLGDRALLSGARTAAGPQPPPTAQPPCPPPPPPTPCGPGHSQSRGHLCPWGPGSPLPRPEPVAGSPRVLSAKGRGGGPREGIRGSGQGWGRRWGKTEKEMEPTWAAEWAPRMWGRHPEGRGQGAGSAWAWRAPILPAVPGPPGGWGRAHPACSGHGSHRELPPAPTASYPRLPP